MYRTCAFGSCVARQLRHQATVDMYACGYVCVHVCVNVFMHVCMYQFMYVFMQTKTVWICGTFEE
jgi:hypothetical protein